MTNEEFKKRQQKITPETKRICSTLSEINQRRHLEFLGVLSIPASIIAFILMIIFMKTPWVPALACFVTTVLALIRYLNNKKSGIFFPIIWFINFSLWFIRLL